MEKNNTSAKPLRAMMYVPVNKEEWVDIIEAMNHVGSSGAAAVSYNGSMVHEKTAKEMPEFACELGIFSD